MKIFKKVFWIVVLVVVIIILVIYFYRQNTKTFQFKSVSNEVATSSMQKYTDSNFGFSLSYPNMWQVESSKSGQVLVSQKDSVDTDLVFINEDFDNGYGLISPIENATTTVHYSFDITSNQWMVQNMAGNFQNSKPLGQKEIVSPIFYTESGLPIFPEEGNVGGYVVPLSKYNFLLVQPIAQNGGGYMNLLQNNPIEPTLLQIVKSISLIK
jgi:hypothetical protein